MKLYCNHNYRIGREPYMMLCTLFQLPVEVIQSNNHVDCQPYLSSDNNNKITYPSTIMEHLIKLAKNNTDFQNNFIECLHPELVEQDRESRVYDFYNYLTVSLGTHKLQASLEIIQTKLERANQYFLNSNKKYMFSDTHIGIADLVLNECFTLIYYIDATWIYDEYQALYKYKASMDTHRLLQSYYCNTNLLLLPISPSVDNFHLRIKGIITQNIDTFHDFAKCQGILYQYKENNVEIPDNCPVSLFPLLIDYSIMENLKKKTLIQQKLINLMSHDYEWYSKILGQLAIHDDFIKKMLKIQEKVQNTKTSCQYNLCIVRNDFMNNGQTNNWLQVEYNCIAISFGFISDKVQKFHQVLFNSYYQEWAHQLNRVLKQDLNKDLMVDALYNGFQLYNNAQAYVLIIAGEWEGNIYDQRMMEMELAKKHVIAIRTTFIKLINNIEVKADGTLIAFGKEIGLVYFRTGYTIDQYETEECWQVREIIEVSKALKCPSMNVQLVNFKKFQQILLNHTEIQRFLSQEEAGLLQENYCKIWGFDDLDKHDQLIEMVRKNPYDYVLKPQREGGGNNYYDEQILEELKTIPIEKRYEQLISRNEYIIMERIKPVPRIGFMLRRGKLDIQAVISEISVLGYFISDKNAIIHNETGGYLVRTKRYLDNEGGVAAGYSVVDSFMVQDVIGLQYK